MASPTASMFDRKQSENSVGKAQRGDKAGFTLKMQAITSKVDGKDKLDQSNNQSQAEGHKKTSSDQNKEDKLSISDKVVYQGE